MATQDSYVGPHGPFTHDTADVYSDGKARKSFRGDQLYCEDAPSINQHVLRLADRGTHIGKTLSVADITNPSELSAIDGSFVGELMTVYEAEANINAHTVYAYDNTVGSDVDAFSVANTSPFTVAALTSGCYWVAVGGYYTIYGGYQDFFVNKRFYRNPASATQDIDEVTDSISVTGSVIYITNTSGGSKTLTSTPMIEAGKAAGQILRLIGATGMSNVVLSREAAVTDSGILAAAATITIAAGTIHDFQYLAPTLAGTKKWIHLASVAAVS